MKNAQKFWDRLGKHDKKEEMYLNSGHVWKEDEDGFIDIFAMSEGYHNGPVCSVCDYSPCWHCDPIPNTSDCKNKN